MARLSIPALTESSVVRYVSLGILYVAQGLPVGLYMYAFPAYFAQNGLSPGVVGWFIGLIYVPWGLKLFAGPFMDRWAYLPMGRRRPWVLGAQLGTVTCIFLMGLIPDPLQNLTLLAGVCVAVNAFMAIQDVAVDGMAVDVLPIDQQSRANGVMYGGQALGVAAATAGGAWVLSKAGIGASSLLLAGAMATAFLVPLLVRERPGERLLPWTQGKPSEAALKLQLRGWRDIGRTLFRAVLLPSSIVATFALFIHRAGDGLASGMMPVLSVQELGWSDTTYSSLNASAKLVGALIGMFLGGWLADRFGRVRMIRIFALIAIALTALMAAFPTIWPETATVSSFVLTFSTLTTLFSIVFSATMMALCWKRVAATQFSLYMAISNMGISFGMWLIGPLHSSVGYRLMFLTVALFYVVVFVLMQFVNVKRHLERVDALEVREQASASM